MSVTDKREIRFDADALVYCLAVSPKAAEGFGLPATTPTEVRFLPDDKAIDIVYDRNAPLPSVRIAARSLAALLVSYCIRSKIPLPRLANKSFRVESDFLALEFITSFSKAPEPESADSASRSVKWVLEATLPEPGGGLGR